MAQVDPKDVSIILPCRDEAQALETLLPRLRAAVPDAELLVVDDGSSDASVAVCEAHQVLCLRHRYGKGNGAAVKTGARAARGRILVFMDADGQHDPDDIPRLLALLETGYDMVVGARGSASQASAARGMANRIYNRLASYMTGQPIPDLTSGFRAVRANRFLEFLYLLPNHFSYPTTITMAFFRAGYHVAYLPIAAGPRIGKSHIRPLQDGVRFLLIIFKIGTLYSPLKIFAPVAVLHFLLGVGYWIYTYATTQRLSIMTIFMMTTGVLIFLIGLVSEQITQLMYRPAGSDTRYSDSES